jgi:hypothetical protein
MQIGARTLPSLQKPQRNGFWQVTSLWEGIMKVIALIFALLTLATVSGAAMVASVHKQPVLLACGGPNC